MWTRVRTSLGRARGPRPEPLPALSFLLCVCHLGSHWFPRGRLKPPAVHLVLTLICYDLSTLTSLPWSTPPSQASPGALSRVFQLGPHCHPRHGTHPMRQKSASRLAFASLPLRCHIQPRTQLQTLFDICPLLTIRTGPPVPARSPLLT